jgi:hypothetical protein
VRSYRRKPKPVYMLTRIEIIQKLIKKKKAKTYLEIGVNNGRCFLRIKAKNKLAVDPTIKISQGRKLKHCITNPCNINNQYFERTSDDFFSASIPFFKSNKPGIVFVDGLHTYEQALKDVLNSLEHLQEGGIILMHDCNPLSAAAAYPTEYITEAANAPGYSHTWNGDVWKTIVHIRSMHQDLNVFVLDCDHGIGVVTRGKADQTLSYSKSQIEAMQYSHLESDRKTLLNLKPESYFYEFMSRI